MRMRECGLKEGVWIAVNNAGKGKRSTLIKQQVKG